MSEGIRGNLCLLCAFGLPESYFQEQTVRRLPGPLHCNPCEAGSPPTTPEQVSKYKYFTKRPVHGLPGCQVTGEAWLILAAGLVVYSNACPKVVPFNFHPWYL